MTHKLPEAPTSASPRPDWASARAYRPNPVSFLGREARDFWSAVKSQPRLAATVFGLGLAAGLLAIALPAIVIAAVLS